MHKFVILINNEIVTFTDFDKIPDNIDNVIEFLPHIPDPPHTKEQHSEIAGWNDKLKELLKRETNASSY